MIKLILHSIETIKFLQHNIEKTMKKEYSLKFYSIQYKYILIYTITLEKQSLKEY